MPWLWWKDFWHCNGQAVNSLTWNTISLTYATRRKLIIGFKGLCGSDCLAHQVHRSIRLGWTLGNSVPTLMSLGYSEEESSYIIGLTVWYQQFSILEAEESLRGEGQQKYPVVTNPETQCSLGIDYSCRKYLMTRKGTDGFLVYPPWAQRKWNRCLPFQNLGGFHECTIAVDWRSARANFYRLKFTIAA